MLISPLSLIFDKVSAFAKGRQNEGEGYHQETTDKRHFAPLKQ